MVVVPDGDVILKAGSGTDALDIQVFGTFLGMASPSYSTMLSSPAWLEHESKVIELYEEDPKIVLAFCNLLHLRWNNVRLWTPKDLVDLALSADMRCCINIVKPWFETKLAAYMAALEAGQAVRKDGGSWLRESYALGEDFEYSETMKIAAILGFDDLL